MCSEEKKRINWLGIITIAITLPTIVVGVYEYRSAQKWKRSEFAAKQIERLYSDEKLRAGLRIFEWKYRDFPMPKEYSNAYDEKIFYHDWEKVTNALSAEMKKEKFHAYSAIYLDVLDRYFDFLEQVSHYEDIGLFEVSDLGNICYAATLIEKNEYDKNKLVFRYLKKYEYDGVFELIEKCKGFD